MAELFSKQWMIEFGKVWNADKEMTDSLRKADFHASIAYGFQGEEKPRGVLFIDTGKVISAGEYDNEVLDWDLRAEIMEWKNWITNGFGLTNLGVAVAQGTLKFEKGEFRKMISNPALATPFLRHFELMSGIKTEYKI